WVLAEGRCCRCCPRWRSPTPPASWHCRWPSIPTMPDARPSARWRAGLGGGAVRDPAPSGARRTPAADAPPVQGPRVRPRVADQAGDPVHPGGPPDAPAWVDPAGRFSFGLAVAAVGEPRRLAHQLFALSEGFLGPLFFVWLGASLDLRERGRHPSFIRRGG